MEVLRIPLRLTTCFLAGLCFMLMGGCTKEISLDIPYEGDKLVLFGVLTPGEVVSIRIGQSVPPVGEHRFVEVSKAVVVLWENEVAVDTLAYAGTHTYQSKKEYRPRIGKSYRITASLDALPLLSTEPVLIEAAPTLIGAGLVASENENQRILTAEFENALPGEQYYELRVEGVSGGQALMVSPENLNRPMGSSVPCEYMRSEDQYLYEGHCLGNRTITQRLLVPNQGYNSATIKQEPVDQLRLRLRHVSKSYYRYYTHIEIGEVERVFQEPQNRYSNVMGGYGILMSYTEISKTISYN
ncbi:DUF4249 domain-containing protein [Telluribacter humicola]|uniref:DUF4249 domain-containing protein n=1 Tax=Telluribacter humicola TaxID=1720261 RepID=UPI001A96F55C|nr:DUF4249 domain-containing protein [Telluribacter humicola]